MSQKFEIIDNFLNEDDFLELKKFITTPRCDWRFISSITFKDKKTSNNGYFVHSFCDRDPSLLKNDFEKARICKK